MANKKETSPLPTGASMTQSAALRCQPVRTVDGALLVNKANPETVMRLRGKCCFVLGETYLNLGSIFAHWRV
jgi:hypothetical protein